MWTPRLSPHFIVPSSFGIRLPRAWEEGLISIRQLIHFPPYSDRFIDFFIDIDASCRWCGI
jgi:hypothetical protein